MSTVTLPQDYHQHLLGEYRQAGWRVSGAKPILKATCPCSDQHVTYIRSGNLTREYVMYKIHWLFNESCYSRD